MAFLTPGRYFQPRVDSENGISHNEPGIMNDEWEKANL